MKTIVVGIMAQDKIRERIYAIARGEYKPKPGEPKRVRCRFPPERSLPLPSKGQHPIMFDCARRGMITPCKSKKVIRDILKPR